MHSWDWVSFSTLISRKNRPAPPLASASPYRAFPISLTYGLALAKMMSTSVAVSFLSRSLLSRHILANFAPSISGAESLSPKEQNSRKASSREKAIIDRDTSASRALQFRAINIRACAYVYLQLARSEPHPFTFLGKHCQYLSIYTYSVITHVEKDCTEQQWNVTN